MKTEAATNEEITQEVMLVRDAERMEKEAARLRESTNRLIRQAAELEHEAALNRSAFEVLERFVLPTMRDIAKALFLRDREPL